MGYTTKFKGKLKFTTKLSPKQLTKIKSFLGEDCRNHPEWNKNNLTYEDRWCLKFIDGKAIQMPL